jgi:hypothetical protein
MLYLYSTLRYGTGYINVRGQEMDFIRRILDRKRAQAQRRAYREATMRKYNEALRNGDQEKALRMMAYLRVGH